MRDKGLIKKLVTRVNLIKVGTTIRIGIGIVAERDDD